MNELKLIGNGRTADVFLWEDNKVLKLFKEGLSLESINKEYSISRVVQNSEIPSPKTFGITNVNKRVGIIYEYINGPTMLSEINNNPSLVIEMGKLLGKVHNNIHKLKVKDLPSQRDIIVKHILEADLLSHEKKDIILRFLSNLPDDNKLCHGDFHPDNIFMTKMGPVVIDWITGNMGNPIADIARTSLLIRLSSPPPNSSEDEITLINNIRTKFYNSYLEQYIYESKITVEGIEKWELPIAAARLHEHLPKDEKLALLKVIDNYIKKLKVTVL